MAISDLRTYVRILENAGLLKRVSVEVDPELEVSEIAQRLVCEDGPAVLFENVKGSSYPIAINLMASLERIELGLGRHPEQIGDELVNLAEELMPPTPRAVWHNKWRVLKMVNILPKMVRRPMVREVSYAEPDLNSLPIIKCWPEDGGRFVTLPLVVTLDPRDNKFNMGMYRMQLYDATSTGMHFQLHKGGGFHLHAAEQASSALPVAVVLGGDPALILSAIAALPEGVDEAGFSGILRGERVRLAQGYDRRLRFPANAEFVLEGEIDPTESRLEGPFGDHFGHYSSSEQFPVFRVKRMSSRRDPIYPATVVGRPPMEDKFLGEATQMIVGPLIKLIHSEIKSVWAYYEAGFHNLLVVSVHERYNREALKTAMGILGQGQLSLTKVIVTVDDSVDPSSAKEVLRAIKLNFRPETDLLLLANTAMDTLDFTGEALHEGSKMVLNACRKLNRPPATGAPVDSARLKEFNGIRKYRVIDDTLLAVQLEEGVDPKRVLRELVAAPYLAGLKVAAIVSNDVDINDRVELIWGIFTRFDCARDIIFTGASFNNSAPVYSGVMGIDASWKSNYPKPLTMPDEVKELVERKWDSYWRG